MLPYTHTIKGKIVVYTYMSLFVFVGILVVMMTKMRFDEMKEDAETILRLEVGEVAETLHRLNLEAVTIAKTLAQTQESTQIYGKRNRSILLLKHVLQENPDYTGVYYCFEPNADGNDNGYLSRPNAYLDAVDSTGRFLPTWIRSTTNPDSVYLTKAVRMASSLYYQGLKVRITSNFTEHFLPPTLKISKHYSPAIDMNAREQHLYMITEPYWYEGKYMVEYTYPIIHNDQFKGIAGIDRKLDSYQKYLTRLRRSWREDLIVVSRLGRVVATTIDTIKTAEPFDESIYADIIRRVYTRQLNDSALIIETDDPLDGRPYYFTGTKIEKGHWLVISRVSVDEILAPIRAQVAISIIVAIMGMAALIPFLMWIANSISLPVEQARDIANEISDGNFDVSIPPHNQATDTGKVLSALGGLASNVRDLIALKQLASLLSGKFINAHEDTVDATIEDTLQSIGGSIGADRAYLMSYDPDKDEMTFTHRWDTARIPSTIDLKKPYSKSFMPYTIDHISQGNVLGTDSLEQLPDLTSDEYELFRINGFKSYIISPMMSVRGLGGALLFASLNEARAWEQKHIELLEIIGNVILNALSRIDREQELAKLNAELEQRVEERTAQLRDANRELEAFSYSVSHDLRTPLRHVEGFTDMLRQRVEGKLEERDRQFLDKISEASRHMGRLIDDLLVFSRMSRIDLVKTSFSAKDLVEEVIQELSPDYKGRTITFAVEHLPMIHGDPSVIRMVFVNLLSNAIKFTARREHAVITISGSTENGMTSIAVKDNGVGFDPDYTHKLFGVFERLHSDTDFEGTGIGLANVRRIIHRHGGTVSAEGALEVGATFTFTIPDNPESHEAST